MKNTTPFRSEIWNKLYIAGDIKATKQEKSKAILNIVESFYAIKIGGNKFSFLKLIDKEVSEKINRNNTRLLISVIAILVVMLLSLILFISMGVKNAATLEYFEVLSMYSLYITLLVISITLLINFLINKKLIKLSNLLLDTLSYELGIHGEG